MKTEIAILNDKINNEKLAIINSDYVKSRLHKPISYVL